MAKEIYNQVAEAIQKAVERPSTLAVDDFDSIPRDEWVYAEVPAETIMGDEFPRVRINNWIFEAGKRHLVPPKYAEHIKILVEGCQKEAIRRLQPKKDISALLQHAQGGSQTAGAAKSLKG